MQLRLESRPIGDVLIVQCHGRIVAGKEVSTLHSFVGSSIDKYGDVVLQLDHLEFIDSSGLGAMVRLLQAARSKIRRSQTQRSAPQDPQNPRSDQPALAV